MSNVVRIGIVGLGGMGSTHARNIVEGRAPRLVLTGVVDSAPERCAAACPDVRAFASLEAMLAADVVDAVLIATPHYAHTPLGIAALEAGRHVLMEKPISVHKADAERLLAAYRGREKNQVFAAMFNQRTDRFYQKIRELVQGGELGEIRRINWIITNWFRTDAYYASGGWRATWAGEGGGVLLNQCPHNLDLLQWLFGLPTKVRAFCRFGHYHEIEVEDDVTAYLEFANGASGVFITSTGEAPGTNRLEIAGERGRLVFEDDRIAFTRNEVPMSEFSRTSPQPFGRPGTWDVSIPACDHGDQHVGILKNFADAILDGAPLVAPATEGVHSVELANAMLLSTWTNETVELPIDARKYERLLKQKASTSTGPKPKPAGARRLNPEDISKSFGR